MNHKIKLGVSLYSFSTEYIHEQLDLEGILRKVRLMGYEGIEIVAAQMVPEYPYPSDEWLSMFASLLKEIGLQPVCWSAYIDMGIRSDRDLTEEEIVAFTVNDLICASKAGFPLVRTQHAISPKLFLAMVPWCRKLGVKLAIEMHHPHHPDLDVWKEFLEIMRTDGDGWLGIVPDFSIFQHRPHRLYLEQAISFGCRKEALDRAIEQHDQGMSLEEALKGDLLEIEKHTFEEIWHKFNYPGRVSQLKEMIDVTPYIHGKFYYLEEGVNDACIPYEEILTTLRDAGYDGYVACEYEGHHFDETVDSAVQLRRYVEMTRRIIG